MSKSAFLGCVEFGKYVDINEIVESAIGRTTVITDKIFGANPFVIMSYAAELTREERAVLKTYEEYSNPFIVKKDDL